MQGPSSPAVLGTPAPRGISPVARFRRINPARPNAAVELVPGPVAVEVSGRGEKSGGMGLVKKQVIGFGGKTCSQRGFGEKGHKKE